VKTLQSFDPTVHVKPSDVHYETDPQGLRMTVLTVPHTKSSASGKDIYYATHNGPTDPETAFQNHLRVNEPPTNLRLFAYKHKNSHRPPTKSAFITRIQKALKAANLQPLQGHGIRIGATLFYLLRGTPFDVVKTIGRWSSDAFLLYLRKHAQIMAPYMQADPNLHTEFIRISMPPVRCESLSYSKRGSVTDASKTPTDSGIRHRIPTCALRRKASAAFAHCPSPPPLLLPTLERASEIHKLAFCCDRRMSDRQNRVCG
jgi:hypothetical protein